MAKEVVARFHDAAAADEAAAEFDRVFAHGALPEDIAEKTSKEKAASHLVKALVDSELCASNSEARRLIGQGGVTVDQTKVSDLLLQLPPGRHLLRVGKRRLCYVTVGPA